MEDYEGLPADGYEVAVEHGQDYEGLPTAGYAYA